MHRQPARPAPRLRYAAKDFPILYEDKDILVVDKPWGLLAVATPWERELTAHKLLTAYIRKGCGRSRKELFVVHRLDRDTSGLLIFAKSETAMNRLKDRWKEFDKKYLAVVQGRPEKPSGIVTSYLAEDSDLTMYSTTDSRAGKLAKTSYRVLKTTQRYALLEVTLLTGRKNQIRVHMADMGHPVVGDTWYGEDSKPQPRMALHAWSLFFRHPMNNRELSFRSEVPQFFTRLVGRIELEDETGEEKQKPDLSNRQ